jgi:hypothetical protein
MTNNILNQPLHMAGFFYKGVSITLEKDVCNLESLVEIMESYVSDVKKLISLEGGPSFMFDQLDQLIEWREEGHAFTQDESMIWCMNIYHLTRLGHLLNDEFNGTSFMYGSLD